MNNFEEMRVPLAFAIGLICFLVVAIPRWAKNYKITKIIKYGKQNQTYIKANVVPGTTKRYYDLNESGSDREYCVADYEYVIDGHTKRYHLVGNSCPAYLPMYYFKDENDVHCENELRNRKLIWQIPFLVGILAGILFMILTNVLVG